jgi:hypothetical protein
MIVVSVDEILNLSGVFSNCLISSICQVLLVSPDLDYDK